jgi:glycine cleavage system H protein
VAPKWEKDSIIYVPCPPKYFKLGYSTWVFKEFSGLVLIGCTDLYLKTTGSIKKMFFRESGEEIFQGSHCGEIKSDDGVSHLIIAPMSGKIIERNRDLFEDSTILEKDPYFRGWLYKIIPSAYEYEIESLISCSVDSAFG